MADTAAHLVDRVLPHVPVRQWVLSLPIRLRYLLAFDRELCRRARRILVRAILGLQRRRARAEGIVDPEVGAVTVVQRLGSSLNLNVHFHSLALDGVFHRSSVTGRLHFRSLPAPSPEEMAVTLTRVRSRILAVVRRHGLDPAEFRLDELPLPSDSATLGACLAARITHCGNPTASALAEREATSRPQVPARSREAGPQGEGLLEDGPEVSRTPEKAFPCFGGTA